MIWTVCVGNKTTRNAANIVACLLLTGSKTDKNGRMVPHQRVANGIDLCEELAVWRHADRVADYSKRRTVRRTSNDPRGTIDRQTAKTQLVRRSLGIAEGRPVGVGLTACPDLTKLYDSWVLDEPSPACFQRTAQLYFNGLSKQALSSNVKKSQHVFTRSSHLTDTTT